MRDKEVLSLTRHNPNMSVPWYIMASYAYYVLDDPFLSDSAFDALAKMMLEKWDVIEHRHKECLDVEVLRAATAPKRYPEIAQDTARMLIGPRRG